ncbi:hypothetical protein D9613_010996 [Agrocybe pediades]|uniref:USP domain-containing protein n=1 Tax=Agrocybe pediades TaxID=84607 RepID=A0A8H4QL47_9AGAR|nr:hypothetical protein D9613_010996 [Agrocybe pediades]
MQLTAEQEQAERDNSDILASLANVDTDTARRVLRKHNGDMQKAAEALLTGDRGETWTEKQTWEEKHRTTPEPGYNNIGQGVDIEIPSLEKIGNTSSSIVDLTANDDEEISRAIQMSMQETSQPQDGQQSQFRPTDRAPHPEWQMAPAATSSGGHDDHHLNEAIQASLQDFHEEAEEPLEEVLREGGRPIALRALKREYAYAALILQAMFFIPQVRATVSNLRLPSSGGATLDSGSDNIMYYLIELFTNLDLAQLGVIIEDDILSSFNVPSFTGREELREISADVAKEFGRFIEEYLAAQAGEEEEPEQLFSFTHGRITIVNNLSTKNAGPEPGMLVKVEFGGDHQYNDLISCISNMLCRHNSNLSTYDIILRPSDVLMFELSRIPGSHSKGSPDPFVYPKTIYLDRFLFDNLALTHTKQKQELQMLDEIANLRKYRETLTRTDNQDSLQHLRSTIHYYENVAESGDDTARKSSIEYTVTHLKSLLAMIENRVQEIDRKIESLQAEISKIYDCPELKMFQYDLRAVLVHSGLPGRKQMYSYVQDTEGVWWKTVDTEVTEVPEETVLSDPTGLHLGAGPYMLFYSRHLSDEQLHEPLVWPAVFSEAVEENNKKLLAMMHPELQIFTNPQSPTSPDVQSVQGRELPAVPGHQRKPSRDNSRAMVLDEQPKQP